VKDLRVQSVDEYYAVKRNIPPPIGSGYDKRDTDYANSGDGRLAIDRSKLQSTSRHPLYC
jgi:hypothetical protein